MGRHDAALAHRSRSCVRCARSRHHRYPSRRTAFARGDAQSEVVDRYCVACHNDLELAGGVSLERLGREELAGHADVWEAVVRKLRTGLDAAARRAAARARRARPFAASLEAGLDAAWARAPNPGARPLARLNRTEYANAIRDLLAYDASAIASTLPADATSPDSTTTRRARVSPTLLEGYATAAMQISRRAVGDRTMGHGETRYTALPGARSARRSRACRSARGAAWP